jgi:hypothetical protein
VANETIPDRNNHCVIDGVPMVCYGDHERHEDCVWEPLIEPMTREAIQQGWRDYDAAIADAPPKFLEGSRGTMIDLGSGIISSNGEQRAAYRRDHPEEFPEIDLYDKPIDLRPTPKPDPLDAAIEHLHTNGDMYGVTLLRGFQRERDAEENAKDTERARQA